MNTEQSYHRYLRDFEVEHDVLYSSQVETVRKWIRFSYEGSMEIWGNDLYPRNFACRYRISIECDHVC
jgi:hypothetical protein